jgi:hypothetical protein
MLKSSSFQFPDGVIAEHFEEVRGYFDDDGTAFANAVPMEGSLFRLKLKRTSSIRYEVYSKNRLFPIRSSKAIPPRSARSFFTLPTPKAPPFVGKLKWGVYSQNVFFYFFIN